MRDVDGRRKETLEGKEIKKVDWGKEDGRKG